MQLLENRVTQLLDLKRELLPEEGGAPTGGTASQSPREGGSEGPR